MTLLFLVLALLLLTLCSGYFSASETALFSLSPMKIRAYQNHSKARKRLIADLVRHPRDLLVTILMLNVCVNILIQNVASNIFDTFAGWSLRVGVPLALTLLFGEVIPKSLALQNNASFAHSVSPVIATARSVLGPLRVALARITTVISKWMFFFLKKEHDITREELEHVLDSSTAHGLVHADEAEMIDGVLDLRDAQVKELMRPREDIIYYDINEPLSHLTYLFVDQECSRLPVSDGEINNILGIVSARQFFIHREGLSTPESVKRILRKPFFVPETTSARHLIRQMDRKGEVVALVVDEYGSISGLLTREDLVEEVIGEIEDRRDQKAHFTEAGDGVIIASGKLELDEFEEIFGVELESPNNMITLAGWLSEQLGDIPKAGTNYVTENFLFHVLASDPNRVRRVYIRRLKGSGEAQT